MRAKYNTKEFIEKAKIVHGDKYDYSITIYVKNHDKVNIKCPNGHIFDQTPHDHLHGNGCRFCSKKCTSTEAFIRLSNEVHGNKYDYSKAEYIGQKVKTTIICKKHGEFLCTPANHYFLKRGCPRCCESKGEIEIRKILERLNISYVKNKVFSDCKYINSLQFDFYIPSMNLCIEFDGAQHFKPIKQFGGIKEFKLCKLRDEAKNQYCVKVGLKLIRIGYKENIEERLNFLNRVI